MNNIYISKITESTIKNIVSDHLAKLIPNLNPNINILIKPNFLNISKAETGVTTDLRILEAIILFLQKNNLNNITLAESGFTDTENIFNSLNVYSLNKYDIKILNLEQSERIQFDFKEAFVLKKLVLPRVVAESDLIINVPKLKTHSLTRVSLGLKNFFGFLYTPQRKLAHSTNIDNSIIDIYTYLTKHLNKNIITIVDSIFGLSGRLGPNIGKPVKLDLIISGSDPISVDSACTKIMGTKPESTRHLMLCQKLGLGLLNNYEIMGEQIEKVIKDFVMPLVSSTLFPVLYKSKNIIFKKRPIVSNPKNCTCCNICVNACPRQCIDLELNIPTINYEECIGCLCCSEGCPNKVFDHSIRNLFLYNLLINLYSFISNKYKQKANPDSQMCGKIK